MRARRLAPAPAQRLETARLLQALAACTAVVREQLAEVLLRFGFRVSCARAQAGARAAAGGGTAAAGAGGLHRRRARAAGRGFFRVWSQGFNARARRLAPAQRLEAARLLQALAACTAVVREQLAEDEAKRKELRRELNDLRLKMRKCGPALSLHEVFQFICIPAAGTVLPL